jgi:outer membrane protein assembly factor BamB
MPRFTLSFAVLCLGLLVFSCKKETSSESLTYQRLVAHQTIVSSETLALSIPSIIRYNPDVDELYIYDNRQRVVFRVDSNGELLGKIGGRGNGPGEFERVSGIFIGNDCLYLVDDIRFVVHQFALNGEFRASFDYGVHSTSPVNKVSVSRDGIVYVPDDTSQEHIFRAFSWEGREVAKIGEVPEGSTLHIDYPELRNAVKDRRAPSFFMRNAFVVPGVSEQTIVYNALGKVHGYQETELKWESQVPPAILDTIVQPYFVFMEQILRQADAVQVLRVYEQGVAKNENVYVSTNSSLGQEMQLHAFDSRGNLHKIYVFESEAGLNGSFDINAKAGLVYVGNSNAEIIAYALNSGL